MRVGIEKSSSYMQKDDREAYPYDAYHVYCWEGAISPFDTVLNFTRNEDTIKRLLKEMFQDIKFLPRNGIYFKTRSDTVKAQIELLMETGFELNV